MFLLYQLYYFYTSVHTHQVPYLFSMFFIAHAIQEHAALAYSPWLLGPARQSRLPLPGCALPPL